MSSNLVRRVYDAKVRPSISFRPAGETAEIGFTLESNAHPLDRSKSKGTIDAWFEHCRETTKAVLEELGVAESFIMCTTNGLITVVLFSPNRAERAEWFPQFPGPAHSGSWM